MPEKIIAAADRGMDQLSAPVLSAGPVQGVAAKGVTLVFSTSGGRCPAIRFSSRSSS